MVLTDTCLGWYCRFMKNLLWLLLLTGSLAWGQHRSTYCASCARTASGRISRSSSAKHEFERQTGYPTGRPGYVVDHVVALKHGGTDSPSNMQWQTKEAAKAKDKVE